jgi:hypothetical protein
MERIVGSIKIKVPIEDVFTFLRDVESRMRLCPAYEIVRFENISGGAIKKGTKLHIELVSDEKTFEYITQVVKFRENSVIATREVGGRLMVTLKLKKIPGGTLLIHDEQFNIPEEALVRKGTGKEEKAPSLVQDMYLAIKELSKVIFGDPEEMRQVREIRLSLQENLNVWLMRIKDTLEERYGVRERITQEKAI